MNLLDFIKQFSDKPKLHGEVWFYILCRINSKINISEILSVYKLSKSSLYRIFSIYKTNINTEEEIISFKIKNSYIYTNTELKKENLKKKVSRK